MGRGGTHALNPSRAREQTLTVRQKAEHFDFLHDSVGGRLVCLARRPTPITMARGRHFIYRRL